MFKIAGHVWSTSKLTTLHGRQIKVPRFILRTREKQLCLFSFLTFPVKQNFPLYFFTNKKKTSRNSIKFPQPQFNDLKNCKWRTFVSGSCHLDRASNVEIGVEFEIFVIVIFFNWGRVLQFGAHSWYYKGTLTLNSKDIIFSSLY